MSFFFPKKQTRPKFFLWKVRKIKSKDIYVHDFWFRDSWDLKQKLRRLSTCQDVSNSILFHFCVVVGIKNVVDVIIKIG